jgi:hypothetical protein
LLYQILVDLSKSITDVDGKVLTQLVVAGFMRIDRDKAHLNRINVFPIADNDTGTSIGRPPPPRGCLLAWLTMRTRASSCIQWQVEYFSGV